MTSVRWTVPRLPAVNKGVLRVIVRKPGNVSLVYIAYFFKPDYYVPYVGSLDLFFSICQILYILTLRNKKKGWAQAR